MSRRPDSTDWMWAQACDLLEQAERMQRRFFRLAPAARGQPTWEPPVDAFEDGRELAIVVAMPGVPPERIEIAAEPGALVVRGERPPPFAGTRLAVRLLEIPYGHFERRIRLPAGRFELVSHELSQGCLALRLRRIDLDNP